MSATTQVLRLALRKRCQPPGWALMEEVRESVGHGSKRSADAIAMSTWEGRGLEIHGFELKASRGDWLRELGDPAKAEPIAKFCDRWWIVAASADVVRDGELPPAWGLLVLRGKVLVTAKEAPKRELVIDPDRGFLAAMLRRATEQFAEMTPNDEVAAKVAEEAALRAESMRGPDHHELQNLRRRDELLTLIEAQLGDVKIWHAREVEDLARAYKLLRAADGTRWQLRRIEEAARVASDMARDLRKAHASVASLLELEEKQSA